MTTQASRNLMADLVHSASATPVAVSPFRLQVTQRDLIQELLRDRRSLATRRSYEKSLREFFRFIAGSEPTSDLVNQFITLDYKTAFSLAVSFKANLVERGLAEATVNNRLAAVKSLVNHAQVAGLCQWSLNGIKNEKVEIYRDTTGISVDQFKEMLNQLDDSLKGKRDRAILRLLWENLLRRNEVATLTIENFDIDNQVLWVIRKGKGSQRKKVDLSAACVSAIQTWLLARIELTGNIQPTDPLFTAVDRAHFGHRLTGDGLYNLVRQLAANAGITKRFSPHRIRHSGATALLDASNGNTRMAQQVTTHAKADTLNLYDDNRKRLQKEGSEILSRLLDD